MCGIAGILNLGPEGAAFLSRSARLLAHRGPDGQGFVTWDGHGPARYGADIKPGPPPVAGLAHLRLAILDLEGAAQPMPMPGDEVWIAFNGEIYNAPELERELSGLGHAFSTRSDTEALLRAYAQWGQGCLERLEGMFAFAVLDLRERTLFLARDPFGIKPLYYRLIGPGLAFSSEIRPLLEQGGPRRVNRERVARYLLLGHADFGEETMFEGVRQLPPGHFLRLSLDGPPTTRPTRYHDLPGEPGPGTSFARAAEELRELFLESVDLHLRADAPIGFTLSGGIDSTAILSCARRLHPDRVLPAFGYAAQDPSFNEERWMRLACETAGASLEILRLSPDQAAGCVDRVIEAQGEPFAGTSIIAQFEVLGMARRAGVKAVLSGQGADELLAGYPPYRGAYLASLLVRGRHREAAWLAWRALRSGPGGALVLAQAAASLLPVRTRDALRSGLVRDPALACLDRSWRDALHVRDIQEDAPTRFRLHDALRRSLRLTLPSLLRYEDRNAMAHSLEGRVPFLASRLASFILSLPEEHLMGPDGTSKNVFREAMRGLAPEAILARRDKIGFITPQAEWLRALSPWLRGVLGGDGARRMTGLDTQRAARLQADALKGRARSTDALWRLANAIRWADIFEIEWGP